MKNLLNNLSNETLINIIKNLQEQLDNAAYCIRTKHDIIDEQDDTIKRLRQTVIALQEEYDIVTKEQERIISHLSKERVALEKELAQEIDYLREQLGMASDIYEELREELRQEKELSSALADILDDQAQHANLYEDHDDEEYPTWEDIRQQEEELARALKYGVTSHILF